MHEYRLDDDHSDVQQEDGWVVCRVFKKKNHNRGFQPEVMAQDEEQHFSHMKPGGGSVQLEPKQNFQTNYDFSFGNSMHLPQLLSPDQPTLNAPSFLSPLSLNTSMDMDCSHNLMKLTSNSGGLVQHERFNGDWTFLDKLLQSSHQSLDQLCQNKCSPSSQVVDHVGLSIQKFPFQYLNCDTDISKFSK
ncbi:hypothetical protein NE237_033268 [Protea cynaroides]|uniref:NAC domain-containing protein n=1 Tax=Protea cynaroides TaxID=273540 RepID=A0A9Q0L6Z1_9MAGN|nr:hypothetical protein NE237_033268 [Protea cynaroides]